MIFSSVTRLLTVSHKHDQFIQDPPEFIVSPRPNLPASRAPENHWSIVILKYMLSFIIYLARLLNKINKRRPTKKLQKLNNQKLGRRF